MNTIRDIIQMNEQELLRNIAGTTASWHTKYNQSAWIYIGNLDHTITEGDLICVLSQYGEIDDLHLVRDDITGISRGFAFCKYSDARSCILAVDNFCGIQLCGRSLRVDHVENYRLPKHLLEKEDKDRENLITLQSATGHAYHGQELANEFDLNHGQDLFAPPPPPSTSKEVGSISTKEIHDNDDERSIQRKERKRQRKESKHPKQHRKDDSKIRDDHHRRSKDRDDHDDDVYPRKKKRKHHNR